ncbi:MAG: potassium channel family protein, partial [Verrucomicrobia bacterium]|nr:potassium channel family protein [Verrucomicrobiota bacterium]
MKRRQNEHQRIQGFRLRACALSLMAILSVGTTGYHLIEGWEWLDCLYMTVITISTVGFGELHPLSDGARLFTVLLIIVGVGTMAVAISILFETVFQRQMRLFMEKRSMQKEIDKLTEHIIVCGYGRMGRNIANALSKTGRTVVVIEMDAQTTEEIERDGRLVVKGDAAEEAVLQQAGIDRASAIVATLGSDADNLFLTLTARGINPDLNIIARTEDERNGSKFAQAGATRVVSPFATGANHIVRLLTRPDVVDFVELVAEDDDIQFEVSQINVDADSPFAGKTLAEGHVR